MLQQFKASPSPDVCLNHLQRLPLLEAMGRVEHVSAVKHNSLQPENLIHTRHPHWFELKGGFCIGAGGSTGLSAPLPILL